MDKTEQEYQFLTYPDPSKSFGNLCRLIALSKTHNKMPVGKVYEAYMPILLKQQYIFIAKDSECIGFASWYYLNTEAAAVLDTKSRYLIRDEVNSGDIFRLQTATAPLEGGSSLMEWLINTHGQDEAVKQAINNRLTLEKRNG